MAISNLGNGSGFIYITDKDNRIISNLANTPDNKQAVISDANTNAALANETTTLYCTDYRRYYLNVDGAQGSIAGASEITNYITHYGFNNRLPFSEVSVSSGIVTYTRSSSIQRIVVDTQSNTATDDVVFIRETNSLISDGDILIIVGEDSSKVSSFYDSTKNDGADATTANGGTALSGVGQMELDGNATFATGDMNTSLMLMYDGAKWYEINRTPAAVVTTKKLRDAEIPVPVSGTKTIDSIAAGENITVQPGVTESVIVVSGTHDIGSGNYTISKPTGGTPKEGEKYTVLWISNLTSTGTVSVFGKTLTTSQYSTGAVNAMEITSTYANEAWQNGIISRNDDAAEDALGNPSTDDMVLTSTTAGVRTWKSAEKTIKTVSATFDTASNDLGGVSNKTVATHTILNDAFPIDAIILLDLAVIEMHTALTVGSSTATIKIGFTGAIADDDGIDTSRNFDAAPYSSATSTVQTNVSGVVKSRAGTSNITVSVGTVALTAGKFTITVPYMTS
tara:strand:- start:7765 stop:9291 length:1527 start_codon:yes stop_codon:yes gene_type:complete